MARRYPQEGVLRDGRRVLIRPFAARDVDALYELFMRLPDEARRFAWDRIDNRAVVEEWGRNLDYEKVLPLLALDGRRVVADATLHRREGGPLRRVGRIRWLLDEGFRGVGLGLLLVNHLIDAARAVGLHHLSCMLISDLERDAIRTLQELGFRSVEFPGYGVDPDGARHDMTMMVLAL